MMKQDGALPLIEAIGLRKSYGDTLAVKGVDLRVRPGEIFGFLGPNGAGKTTTIKMLIGLLRPTSGVARIGGHDIQQEPIAAKSLIGYVPDQPYLPEKLTAREFLEFIAGLYQIDRAAARRRGEELLKLFGLADRGAAVFLSTHILEIAERMCDRIGIINQGRLIAAGTMDELRRLGKGESRLEDIFLSLTGGGEDAEIAEVLK